MLNTSADEILPFMTYNRDCVMLPKSVTVSALILLAVDFVLSTSTNLLLVITVYKSSSLRTPPNMHLVNICTNNFLVTFNSALSFTSMLTVNADDVMNTALDGIIFFISVLTGFVYCCCLTSIGYFRYRTNKKPTISLLSRQKLVHRSLFTNWIVSVIFSTVILVTFKDSGTILAFNAFKRCYSKKVFERFDTRQVVILSIVVLTFVVGLALTIYSYCRIIRSMKILPKRKMRVEPISIIGKDSLKITTSPNLFCQVGSNDRWVERRQETPKTSQKLTIVVRYVTQDNIMTLEDALERPQRTLASKTILTTMLSNSSTNSIRSDDPAFNNFTDITPSAEFYRLQENKKKAVLTQSTLNRDQKSLSGATKNGLVMVATFLLCTVPIFICALTDVLSNLPVKYQKVTVLYCWVLYYFIAPAYPLWYLIFSDRVRKCVGQIYENWTHKLSSV